MRSVDRIIKTQKQQNSAKGNAASSEFPDEVEITTEKRASPPLNESSGIFDRDLHKSFGGINTAPSVFDQKALFHVKAPEK